MNCKLNFIVFYTLLASLVPTSFATGQVAPGGPTSELIDATTLEIYREYIVPVGKFETDSVKAAIELVAVRSERQPKFRDLLRKDFATSRQQNNDGYDSRKLLSLITAVLDRDGAKRWQFEETKRLASPAQRVLLSSDDLYRESPLLADTIKYGRKCGRSEIDDFTFAVRQAHHPQGEQFLLDVLHNPVDQGKPIQGAVGATGKWPDNTGGSWLAARFHAAVGLAELGVEDGVKWLIEHAKPNDFGIDSSVDSHRHALVGTSSLRANCIAVLYNLSGIVSKGDGSQQDWDEWWHENATSLAPHPVALNP
jgi:hypothetical protein